MTFPYQTLETIFANYYTELENISVSIGYTDYFRQFAKDLDLEKLFTGYFKRYLEQIPVQACDKVNENFYRTTFYELCTRYLSKNFVLNIEFNYPSGRSDFEFSSMDKAGVKELFKKYFPVSKKESSNWEFRLEQLKNVTPGDPICQDIC